jgi:hypothetical protein
MTTTDDLTDRHETPEQAQRAIMRLATGVALLVSAETDPLKRRAAILETEVARLRRLEATRREKVLEIAAMLEAVAAEHPESPVSDVAARAACALRLNHGDAS